VTDSGPDAQIVLTAEQIVEGLCRLAVRYHRILDAQSDDPEPELTVTLTVAGKLGAVREALCLAHGWDPDTEADKEGRADEFVLDWWERHHPADWRP